MNQSFGQNPFVTIPQDIDQNPFRLVWDDLQSVFLLSKLLPLIIVPFNFNSGPLDELYPSWSNIWAVALHVILLFTQLLMIITLPIMAVIFWFLPGLLNLLYFAAFVGITLFFTRLLNGPPTTEALVGLPDGIDPVNDEHELWFFINGVSVGKGWLQSNLDLLAQTFQREVVGIRNITNGFIFDLIECLIQRDLDYKTRDIRLGRTQIRQALAAPATKKVVLITHSQGGIEGSSIVDWLLADLSIEVMSKLEIYNFGNAARHFNNPLIKASSPNSVGEAKGGRGERVIKHIEHYANSQDFVANIGVLNFTSPQAQPYADGNAFYGPVFVREGTGHLLNMHYLDTMFTMVNGKVDENNEFINSIVQDRGDRVGMANGNALKRIKDVSRLWEYRNGGKPSDD
ncbi:hypothetical protein BDZ45DRAFT_657313 [Acephala macrosclerotiorum]|nr:hypothetical protein BDZ45DRAFT_657313 [Acephala macrosclerotiorum]